MSGAVKARPIGREDLPAALALLRRDCLENLYLLDLTDQLGASPELGEARPEIVGVWREGEIAGVAALRPTVIFDAGADSDVVEALLPYVEMLEMGLVKSSAPVVDLLWDHLSRRRGRRALVDRAEISYAVRAHEVKLVEDHGRHRVRAARREDLEPLVFAARESLREERRPDPFAGNPRGFRRWVRGRVPRARVVESEGSVVFTGYADVQRSEGWLLQGVYTWPAARRRGIATVGVSELCREAFAAETDHVQLSVVDGNEAGRRLYEGLGFEPFAELRTILFT
jgi:RimJ/RimL family protein N-acetyltransferase